MSASCGDHLNWPSRIAELGNRAQIIPFYGHTHQTIRALCVQTCPAAPDSPCARVFGEGMLSQHLLTPYSNQKAVFGADTVAPSEIAY